MSSRFDSQKSLEYKPLIKLVVYHLSVTFTQENDPPLVGILRALCLFTYGLGLSYLPQKTCFSSFI